MQILCILFLTLVSLSVCKANENTIVFEKPDPEVQINAFLDMQEDCFLDEGYLSKSPEHVPHEDLDRYPDRMSGLYLFLLLSLGSTIVFSFVIYKFVQCVKDHYKCKGKYPIAEIV